MCGFYRFRLDLAMTLKILQRNLNNFVVEQQFNPFASVRAGIKHITLLQVKHLIFWIQKSILTGGSAFRKI
jgi:hypothetical protein